MSFSVAPLAKSSSRDLTSGHAAVALFAFLAAIFLAWPVWRAGLPIELSRNEPWNAWFTDTIFAGTPLYPGPNELIVNNYPPLSFYITAAVSALTGDTILAGRLIALLSVPALAVAAGVCIRALGGSVTAAGFGGFWLLATFSRFCLRHVGVDDPALLAQALMGLGLAYFLCRMRAGRAVEPAIALMVLAGFVKHNTLAFPLAALIWLAMHDRRAAARATLFGAALCAGGLFLCTVAYGPNFAQQMLTPRVISLAHMLSTVNKLQWIAPALLFWGFWAWANRKEPAAQFTALLIGLSLVSGLIQAAGAGVVYNSYFEVMAASAIAVALAFEGIGSTAIAKLSGGDAARGTMIAVLALRLLAAQHLECFLVLASPSFREETRQGLAAFEAEVTRVRSIPGPVACSVMTVCYRAGKAFVYDVFWIEQRIAKGVWTADEAGRMIEERGIRFEQIDPTRFSARNRSF